VFAGPDEAIRIAHRAPRFGAAQRVVAPGAGGADFGLVRAAEKADGARGKLTLKGSWAHLDPQPPMREAGPAKKLLPVVHRLGPADLRAASPVCE